jgi:hypothetical protein
VGGLESAFGVGPVKGGNGASAQNVAHALAGSMVQHYDDDRTVISTSSPLSHAFAESVGPDSHLAASLAQSGDEWYVGINGVPVGPIRLSELRSKAAAGAITTESLVWRDGFEQWMNLRLFPELVAIVEEGVSSARASLTPLSPSLMPSPSPPAAPRPEVYDPFKLPGGAGTLGDPFAPDLRAGSTPGPVVPMTGPGVVSEDLDAMIPKRRSAGLAAWIAVGVALALGLTVGFVVFSKAPPEPIVKYVEVPAKSAEGVTPAASNTVIEETEVTADGGIRKIARAGGPLPAKTDEPKKGGLNLGDLQGGGVSGPHGGSGSESSGPKSGQPLDSASIQKTVGRYTGSVKRSCWQPALDGRSKDAPSSARVSVSIVVSPSGSVQSATTSGDPKGYPGLSSCIASRVRGWQFDPSSGTTTVNVPFVFAAQ